VIRKRKNESSSAQSFPPAEKGGRVDKKEIKPLIGRRESRKACGKKTGLSKGCENPKKLESHSGVVGPSGGGGGQKSRKSLIKKKERCPHKRIKTYEKETTTHW